MGFSFRGEKMRGRRGFRGRRVIRPRIWRPMFWWPRLFLMGGFMYFLFGSTPYKISKDDVTVIEKEAGKQAKNLSEEELVAAMKKLGIKKLEVSADELDIIENA
jgi:hypothetical protein